MAADLITESASSSPRQPTLPAVTWHAFLSHAHRPEGRLVAVCQRMLERIGMPWYRRRRLRLFRAQGAMPYEARLWDGLQRALEASEHFILFASPEAVRSDWVRDEVAWWLEHRGTAQLIIVLVDGSLSWHRERGGFDPASTAFDVARFGAAWTDAPWIVDLRPFVDAARWQAVRQRAGLRAALMQVAARLHGRPLDELVDIDARHRARLRLGLGTLGAVALLASAGAWLQFQQARLQADAARLARAGELRALALELAADGIGAEAAALLAEAGEGLDAGGPAAADLQRVLAWWLPRLTPAQALLRALPRGQLFEWADQVHLVGPRGLERLPEAGVAVAAAYGPHSDTAYLIDTQGRVQAALAPTAAQGRVWRVLGSLEGLSLAPPLRLFELLEGQVLAVATRDDALSAGAEVPTVRFFAVRQDAEAVEAVGWEFGDRPCLALGQVQQVQPVRPVDQAPEGRSGASAPYRLLHDPTAAGLDVQTCTAAELAPVTEPPMPAGLVQARREFWALADGPAGLPRLAFPEARGESRLWLDARQRLTPERLARVRALLASDAQLPRPVLGARPRQALARALSDAFDPAEYDIGKVLDALAHDDWAVNHWRRDGDELVLTTGAEGSKFSGVYACRRRTGERPACAMATVLPPPGARLVVSPDWRWVAVAGISVAGWDMPSFELIGLSADATEPAWQGRPPGSADDFAFDTLHDRLAVRVDDRAHVYDLKTGARLAVITLSLRATAGAPAPERPADEATEQPDDRPAARPAELPPQDGWRIGPSRCLALAGDWLLECRASGQVRAWSVASSQLRWARQALPAEDAVDGGRLLDAAAAGIGPRKPAMPALSLSADQQVLAVYQADRVRMLDVSTGIPLGDVHRLPAPASAAARTTARPRVMPLPAWLRFDADGALLVLQDGVVHVRPAPPALPNRPTAAAIGCLTGWVRPSGRTPVDLAGC